MGGVISGSSSVEDISYRLPAIAVCYMLLVAFDIAVIQSARQTDVDHSLMQMVAHAHTSVSLGSRCLLSSQESPVASPGSDDKWYLSGLQNKIDGVLVEANI